MMRRSLLILLCSAVVHASLSGRAPAAQDAASADSVSRFLARRDAPVTAYRALRRLEARNERFHVDGWLEAMTELSPEAGFSYQVVREGGSGYIRNKVLRAALEGEKKMIRDGEPTRAALTMENYELAMEEITDPDGLVRLIARPRRKDTLLIDGRLFVTPDDADLVRVEGRLSKNPSFWTREVTIVRRYGRIAGVRVPVSLESVAKVRIAGRSSLSMTYRYEMVNGEILAAGPVTEQASGYGPPVPAGTASAPR
jgi:hypothetical protein